MVAQMTHGASPLIFSHLEDFLNEKKKALDDFFPNIHTGDAVCRRCRSVRPNVGSPSLNFRGRLQSTTEQEWGEPPPD